MIEGGTIFLPMMLLAFGALITSLIRGRLSNYITSAFSIIASAIMLYISYIVLVRNHIIKAQINIGPYLPEIPLNFTTLFFSVDNLSGIFIFILGLVSLLSSLYSISYMGRFYNKEHLGFYGFNYMIFLLSMYLILTIRDLFWFIVFWGVMTLTSQFLVSYEKERKLAVWGGYKYFAITKAGAELLIIGILTLIIFYCDMNTNFLILKHMLNPNNFLDNIVIALLFVGFAVKASLAPFHTWLPDAHPEAPSHVSALLSGVMVKIPIYMIFRLFYHFSEPNLIWGIITSVIGIVTVFIGGFYALLQNDSKRLLAYSSIENIGIIILSLGVSLYFLSLNTPFYNMLGALALFASLYHVINHALCKSLLFMVAGSVYYRTGFRDLDVLGGLAKYMPLTSLTAIIGALSIAGIPPFNGFLSKWLLYVSTLASGTPYVIIGILLLFIGSITIAVYIKFYTTIFRRAPKKLITVKVKESPLPMTISLILLAILCVVFGIFPIIPYSIVRNYIYSIYPLITHVGIYPGFIVVPNLSIIYPLLLSIVLISTIVPLIATIYLGYSKSALVPWASGMPYMESSMSVSSRSYYDVFRIVFGEIYALGKTLYNLSIIKASRFLNTLLKVIYYIIENPPYMIALFLLLIILSYVALWMGWFIVD